MIMKVVHLIVMGFTLFLLTACKTTDSRESAFEAKRMELESLVAKYGAMNLAGNVNWDAFHAALKDDELVARLDIGKVEACLSSLVAHSNNFIIQEKESGCKSLSEEAFSYSGEAHLEFRERNKEAFSRCDSLRKSWNLGFATAFAPCVEIFGRAVPPSNAAPESRKHKEKQEE